MQECAWTAEPRPSIHSCSSVLDDTINRHVIHYNRRKNAPEPGAFLLDSNDDGSLPVFPQLSITWLTTPMAIITSFLSLSYKRNIEK